MNNIFLGAAAGALVLGFSVVGASAELACSDNVCWHVHEHYDYPSAARVVVHPDDWHHGDKVQIREHEGRGYWHGDRWTEW